MITVEKTDVLVVGITGNLGGKVAHTLDEDPRYNVLPWSVGRRARTIFSGPKPSTTIITPENFENDPQGLTGEGFVVVDASNMPPLDSARIFSGGLIPLLQLGTVGYGDKVVAECLEDMKAESPVFYLMCCMNAAIPVISLINSLEGIGNANPKAFVGCNGHVAESHQKRKTSVPGTAKKLKKVLEAAGAEVDEIESVRDPEIQRTEWGVPEEHLDRHGYHRVTVEGENLSLGLRTAVNGLLPYAIGVRDLVLPALIEECLRGSNNMLCEY